MSLTKQDLQEVQHLIHSNNDVLMSRIIDVLKDFPTRAEMQSELEKLSQQMVKREEFLELKDEVTTIRIDLSMLITSVQSLADTVVDHARDMRVIKQQLHIQG